MKEEKHIEESKFGFGGLVLQPYFLLGGGVVLQPYLEKK